MGERQQVDGDAAGPGVGQRGAQRLEGASVGRAGEQAVAVGQAEQRHGLAA